MGFGDFDQPVTFETPTGAPDGFGGTRITWTAMQPRAWAKVTTKSQSETERQGSLRASRLYLFEIHYRKDITEAMRMRWNGEILNIRQIQRGSPRDLCMKIVAEAGVTQ